MTMAQLAFLPARNGRRAERRIVNLAARLRDPGARIVDVDIVNLSTDGFMARVPVTLETGSFAWLKLAGMEPQHSRVAWIEDGQAGFEFVTPLHPATVQLATAMGRKPAPLGHFGAPGRR
ncbi:MAG: hypothetical protein KF780_00940 [Sphingomonas sp.]|nr:hypothetical protein [Sphingomonas sp.]